jgi:hypothetical protein
MKKLKNVWLSEGKQLRIENGNKYGKESFQVEN